MKLKTIIKDIIKEEVSKQISLTEAFKSSIMAKIDKAAKNTSVRNKSGWQNKNIYKYFSSGLAKLGINASDINNEQFTELSGNEAKRYMRQNPEDVLFFLTNKEDQLVAVMKNNRHVSIYPNKTQYRGVFLGKGDPKHIRNTKDKNNTSYASDNSGYTGKVSKDSKTGLTRTSGTDAEDVFISQIKVYALTFNSSTKSSDRVGKEDLYYTQYHILDRKRSFYKKQIENLRAAARKSKDNPQLIKFTNTAADLTTRGLKFIEDVMKNPEKYTYSTIDKTITYSHGRDVRTYVTSFPKLFVELQKSIKYYSDSYNNGEDSNYGISSINRNIEDIEKILTKFNF